MNQNFSDINNKKFEYEIKRRIAQLGSRGYYTVEFNIVKYNGLNQKYDIRLWYRDEKGMPKMGRGICLTPEEAEKLKKALNDIDIMSYGNV